MKVKRIKELLYALLDLMELPFLAILECIYIATMVIVFWIVMYGLYSLIKLVF